VLSRQVDETIMIGDDIEVTVVDIRGDKVRLGITAPKEIAVHRKEVYEAIKRENRAAAQVKPEDLPNNLGGLPRPSPGPKATPQQQPQQPPHQNGGRGGGSGGGGGGGGGGDPGNHRKP